MMAITNVGAAFSPRKAMTNCAFSGEDTLKKKVGLCADPEKATTQGCPTGINTNARQQKALNHRHPSFSGYSPFTTFRYSSPCHFSLEPWALFLES
jgi:hypothetical protein